MSFSMRLVLAAVLLLACTVGCKQQLKPVGGNKMKPGRTIEIVPGRSIGEVELGARADGLPSRAKLDPPGGTLDGVHLLVGDGGTIADIWIDDIRTFPHELACQGRSVSRQADIDTLGRQFGGCERIAGLKGGIFYNCANGLAMGTDFGRQTLQLRVKPISSTGR